MVWFRSFGDKKYRVVEKEGFRNPAEKFYRGTIESPRFKMPKSFLFRTKSHAISHMEYELDNQMSYAKRNYDEKQRMKALNPQVNVGDIYVNSWGYDQTNVNYYQVVKKKNKSVYIRPIGAKRIGDSSVMPIKNNFVGEAELRRISPYSGIKTEYGHAGKWSGKPNYETPPGMGH